MKQRKLFAQIWDAFIMLCATASALAFPIGLVLNLELGTHVFYVEWFVTIAFAADLIVRYRRLKAQPVKNYLASSPKKGLLLDILAALPFYALLGPSPFQLLRLLKLYRVTEFMRRLLRSQIQHASVLRLAFFAYWLMLAAHWITCGWVALRTDHVDDPTRYLDAFYWCVTTLTTVGYGDIAPVTNAQKLYAIGVMILGVGMYAYIIGNIATILSNIDPARAKYIQQRERLTAFMAYRHLPRPLQHRIYEYYDYLWENQLIYDEWEILQDLTPSLRTDVALFLKRNLIENVPLFQGASDDFVREVALELTSLVVMPGDYIVRAGQPGREMYFINRGEVEILSPDGQTTFRTLSNGEYFGEIALFLDRSRTASARAISYCDLYQLDAEMFKRILSHYPDIAAQMEALAQQRHGVPD